jgi:hypothetical protein
MERGVGQIERERQANKEKNGARMKKHSVCPDWEYFQYMLADGTVFGTEFMAVI